MKYTRTLHRTLNIQLLLSKHSLCNFKSAIPWAFLKDYLILLINHALRGIFPVRSDISPYCIARFLLIFSLILNNLFLKYFISLQR